MSEIWGGGDEERQNEQTAGTALRAPVGLAVLPPSFINDPDEQSDPGLIAHL